MHTLMHWAGRAWYYMIANYQEDHLILRDTREVPSFLRQVQHTLNVEKLGYDILDIEGCYPNMPKDKIRQAMREIVEGFAQSGYKGVYVPRRSKTKPCKFRCKDSINYVWLSKETLIDILDFSLDQAVFVRLDGKIMRQRKGIPMGDALSPAMTIGTCGWMEKEWLRTLSPLERAHFLAKRYMDDILIFYEKDTQWDHEGSASA